MMNLLDRLGNLFDDNQSTLGQAPHESIADTKLIEKSAAGNAPRSSSQETVSDPIEKITDTERYCPAMGHFGGKPLPDGICDQCGEPW